MTLRLRRGTDLERQSITFQEGELVYITDTKDLYAGDGTTVGGIKVSNIGSPSSLTQNLNLNGYSIQGSGTISATSFVGDGSGLTGIDIGVQSGQEYDIDIRGTVRSFDSTVIIDPITNTIYGNFYGDGSNLTNVPGTIVPSGDYTINILGYVKSFDDEVIVDPSTKNIYGNFYGDGSNLTNIPSIIPGNDYTINILGYVKSFDDEIIVDPSTKTLYGDFIGSHLGSLRANDSTLLVDADTNAFFGTFVGDGSSLSGISLSQLNEVGITSPQYGDLLTYDGTNWTNFSGLLPGDYYINVIGSVFSDNSSLVVDGATGSILADQYTPSTGTVEFSNLLTNNRLEVYFRSQDARPKIYFETTLGGTVLSRNDPSEEWAGLYIRCNDDDGTTTSVVFNGGPNHLSVGHSSTGSFSPSVFTYFADGNVGIGIVPTEKFEVNGNGIFSGDVTASAFKGSLMSDDSTTIVDGITGRIFAPSYIQFGAVTRPERDLITPANGMVIYNSTVNRFQGYQGGSWINLDDGTADI
jgi:hypothetical protein